MIMMMMMIIMIIMMSTSLLQYIHRFHISSVQDDVNSVAFRQYVRHSVFSLLKNTESVLQTFAHWGTTKLQTFQQNTAVC